MFSRPTMTSLILGTLLIITAGCDSKKQEDAPSPKEEPAAPAVDKADPGDDAPSASNTDAKKTEIPVKKVAPTDDEIPMEVDPAATEGIESIDFTGKILKEDDQIKDAYSGKVLKSVSWQDKYGQSAFIITFTELKNGGGRLNATHLTREGDASWSKVREFKELISECEFDLVLDPVLDPKWSLTDLDKDGLAEVTFAWRADCTSDVSPSPYKVLMNEHGDKYAIRGTTQIIIADEDKVGGEHTVDPSFKKAPEAFLAHAQKVWDTTSVTDYTN